MIKYANILNMCSSVCVCVCVHACICLPAWLAGCLAVWLSVCPSMHTYIHAYTYMHQFVGVRPCA